MNKTAQFNFQNAVRVFAFGANEMKKSVDEMADGLRLNSFKVHEEGVLMLSKSYPTPKIRRKSDGTPPYVEKAIGEYKAAYRARYGVPALSVEWRDGYVYIEAGQGISVELLRKRTRQLRRLT